MVMPQSLTMNSFLKEESQMNAWESVFLQSRINDGYYDESELPQRPWRWPEVTWFRVRLEQVRKQKPTVCRKILRRLGTQGSPELN